MEILFVISVVLVDCLVLNFFLYYLLYDITNFFKQRHIQKFCRYRDTKEKPGPACVICPYNRGCGRADQSEEYRWYILYRSIYPFAAEQLFNDILEAEKAKEEASKQTPQQIGKGAFAPLTKRLRAVKLRNRERALPADG